jgi:predicted transcriptional regulator
MSTRVADLMTTPRVACAPSDDLKFVMAEMTHKRSRHLPVLDEAELEVSVLRDYARATVA